MIITDSGVSSSTRYDNNAFSGEADTEISLSQSSEGRSHEVRHFGFQICAPEIRISNEEETFRRRDLEELLMSRRPAKKNGATKTRDAARALYVYCVGERDALAPLFGGELPEAIEDSGGLELVAAEGAGELAAVVSGVPLADYGEEALSERLTDASWTAARAVRHERALEFFAARASVVPLRFGTIYLRREGVERMLAERTGQFAEIVERLRGREEWGVNVFCDRKRVEGAIESISPRLREMSEGAAKASPGQGYLLKKKIEAMRADEVRVEIRRATNEIEAALGAAGEGSARLRLLKAETTENGELVAKLAFLVARERFAEFRAAAERVAGAQATLGVRLELTGPWPAYNFAATTTNEDAP